MLSGGERTRLAMIKLLLEPVNFLILDEPTNHLDMRSKDVLKDAIREFDGTVILVSHDRDFLDGLATKVYEFGGGIVKRTPRWHLRLPAKEADRKPERIAESTRTFYLTFRLEKRIRIPQLRSSGAKLPMKNRRN